MNKHIVTNMFVVAILTAATLLRAESIPADRISSAAIRWMAARELDSSVKKVRTFRGTGAALIHVAELDGGGFIVFSGDDRLPPVRAFSTEGTFDGRTDGPALILLLGEASAMLAAVEDGETMDGAEEWLTLLAARRSLRPASVRADDYPNVRFMTGSKQIIFSEWGQTTHNNLPDELNGGSGIRCYNYYTPPYLNASPSTSAATSGESDDNTPPTTSRMACGCVATAAAQVMRHWEYPKKGVVKRSNVCGASGYPGGTTNMTMLVRDGGGYDFSCMPLRPQHGRLSSKTCAAIGKLTHDIGVACCAKYGKETSMNAYNLAERLKDTFKFQSSRWVSSRSLSDGYDSVLANLAAGCPVMVSLPQHCVVVDGYGYDIFSSSKLLYLHFNFGWNGSGNFWYQPPTASTPIKPTSSFTYNSIDAYVMNVSPDHSGALVAGFVKSKDGISLAGVSVELLDADETKVGKTASTDDEGRFHFWVGESGTYVLNFKKDGYGAASWTVTGVQVSENSLRNGYVEIFLQPETFLSKPEFSSYWKKIGEHLHVEITCAEENAEIFYTTDGSLPSEKSEKYAGPFELSGQGRTYVQTVAVKNGVKSDSSALVAEFSSGKSAHDNFSNARYVSGSSGKVLLDNARATAETGEPDHGLGIAFASVWLKYCPSADGNPTFKIDGEYTDAGGTKTYVMGEKVSLAVYQGNSLTSLSRVGGSMAEKVQQASFEAKAGETYYIAVDSPYFEFPSADGKGVLVSENTITVTWTQGREDTVCVSDSEIFANAAGGEITVPLTATADVRVLGLPDWVHVVSGATVEGSGDRLLTLLASSGNDKVLRLSVDAYYGADIRCGQVLLASGDEGPTKPIVLYQGDVTWANSKADALETALETGRRVLMICGRTTCSNTSHLRLEVCSDSTVKPLLLEGYVLWFCNYDTQREDYSDYAQGLGSYTLPLVCIIDPVDPSRYVARSTGYLSIDAFKNFLAANPDTTSPTVPIGVCASVDENVTLTWSRSRHASGYDVWRGTKWASGLATRIAANVSDCSYTDDPDKTNVLYHYWVQACSSSEASAFSDPVTVCRNEDAAEANALGVAIGTPHVRWCSEGTYPWTSQSTNTFDGVALQSAAADPKTSGLVSSVSAEIYGYAKMSFRYKTRMYASRFYVSIDDDIVMNITESSSVWNLTEVVIPPGRHTVTFTYEKSGYYTSGFNGAYLDDLRFDALSDKPAIRPVSSTDEDTARTFVDSLLVSLDVPEGSRAFYTLDGSEPSTDAMPYGEPFSIDKTTRVRCYCIDSDGLPSGFAEALYLERHPVRPGEWTVDLNGALKSAMTNGNLIAVMASNLSGCSYSRTFYQIATNSAFLAWARENGVYLVRADSKYDVDYSAAYSWFSERYNEIGSSSWVYYPTLVFASAWNPNTALGYGLFRSGQTINGNTYSSTVSSLETVIGSILVSRPSAGMVDVVFKRNAYPYTATTNRYQSGQCLGTLPTPDPRTGYQFGGWWDSSSSGTQYDETSTVPFAALALYARWHYRTLVTFDANGGTGDMASQTFLRGQGQSLNTCLFQKSGYAFAGWATSAKGNACLADGQTISEISSDYRSSLTLYAVWYPIAEDGSWMTVETDVPVPYSWLEKYGLSDGVGAERAASALTGKNDADGRPLSAWEEYVAGTDPTDLNSKFTASISFVDGNPTVTHLPVLDASAAEKRTYTTLGKVDLKDAKWEKVQPGSEGLYNFFKVTVEMK